MANLSTRSLPQYAVYWAKTGYGNYGEITRAAPVEIRCRWRRGRKEGVDSNGNKVAMDSWIIVDRELAVGSIIRLGKLVDLPDTLDNLEEVVDYLEIPNLKGRQFRRSVMTKKLNDTLPDLG